MKKLLFLIVIFCALKANAQTYNIYFGGTGAATSVTTVIVENLTEGTSLSFDGYKTLELNIITTGINKIENEQSSEIKIYPNPMAGNSILQVYPPAEGNATITVSDMNGKQIARIQSYLQNYLQEFRLSGINSGLYLVSVKGNTYQYSGKLLCNGKSNGTISIEKVSNNTQVADKKVSNDGTKSAPAPVEMSYTTGDWLKFTGISGNYSTVITDVPTANETITFNFIACTDGDNNNYPVVEIGTQVWMAENLMTTKYSNGDLIGTTSPATLDISGESTPEYQWAYDGDESNVAIYGRLYTWYAVTDSRNVCPTNWHLPTNPEWKQLEMYLGMTQDQADAIESSRGTNEGGKLKEVGAIHWFTPNGGATNESGFTALPGGGHEGNGESGDVTYYGYWWSSTEFSTTYAYFRRMDYDNGGIFSYYDYKQGGFSVRCLKDN